MRADGRDASLAGSCDFADAQSAQQVSCEVSFRWGQLERLHKEGPVRIGTRAEVRHLQQDRRMMCTRTCHAQRHGHQGEVGLSGRPWQAQRAGCAGLGVFPPPSQAVLQSG